VYFYELAGLSVESDIALPGAVAAAPRAAEVTIARALVPERLECASASGPNWSLGDDAFLLVVPGIARFLMTQGRRIAVEIEDGVAEEEAGVFLAGTVFGILLHQRRHIVLHASAIAVQGGAVLFCGPSGAGKSTLAAALAQRGYPFVTDDFCVIATGAGAPRVFPDGRLLKLWDQAIDRLGLQESRGEALRARIEKFYVEPKATARAALPLRAVYLLQEARPPRTPGVERPNVVDAALILRRNAYRPQMVVRMGQKAEYFGAAAEIANAAGVFTLTRSLGFGRIAQTIEWLEAHWRATGLTETAA
jgi:hypothetical protein